MYNDPFPLTQCKTISLEEFHQLPKTRYVMEPKVDGWRMQIEAGADGVRCWTRTQHSATGKIPMVERWLKNVAKNSGHSFRLDGEVVYLDPDGNPDFNFTARCLGSYVDTCIMKQEETHQWLSFLAFDILRIDEYDHRQVPLEQRQADLHALVPEGAYVQLMPLYVPTVDQHAANIERFLEGSVLKDIKSPYAGKRHKSWLKWKAEETVDVKIIGYTKGQGKFAEMIGAITWEAPNGVIGNCSGMDDETREFITKNRQALMGKWIEIKHYGVLVDGYRHPQFMRFRFDK